MPDGINRDELAICRRRGHATRGTDFGWLQCEACGMWIRENRMIEERKDEPPETELHPSVRTKRHLDAVSAHLDQRMKREGGPEAR